MFAIRARHAFDGRHFAAGGTTVLIDDGMISGIETGSHPLADGIPVIDFPDATVLPGLIDSHTHLVGDSEMRALERVEGYSDTEIEAVMGAALRRQLAAGVTTVRDLGDRKFCAVDRRDAQRSNSRSPEPLILAAGPPLTSLRGHCWYMGGQVDGRDGLRRAIAERVERGVDIVKIMASGGITTADTDILGTQFTLDELRLAVELSHAAGLPITAHAHSLASVHLAIAARVDAIEHCTCLTDNGPVISTEMVERIVAGGITVCLTLGFDEAALAGVTPPPGIQLVMERLGLDAASLRATRHERCALLHRGGVRMLAGVDSGIGAMKPHGFVSSAVAEMVAAGMPHEAALASATSISADALGLGSAKGHLRAGYDADLVVVPGDLASTISGLAHPCEVFLGGRRLAPETADVCEIPRLS